MPLHLGDLGSKKEQSQVHALPVSSACKIVPGNVQNGRSSALPAVRLLSVAYCPLLAHSLAAPLIYREGSVLQAFTGVPLVYLYT